MKTVIEMAREAGFLMENSAAIQAAERFAELVRADEREACATECERMMMYPNARQESAAHDNVWAAAKAIRARSRNENSN